MGHHYLPQFYLRGFASGLSIWAHDKVKDCSFRTQVKTIANETQLYTDELENRLNSDVEGPANPVLERVRRRELIGDHERSLLAKYIVVMWKRVPEARRRVIRRLPGVVNEVEAELNSEFDLLQIQHPSFENKITEFRARVTAELDRNLANPSPEIWHKSIESSSGPRVVNSLLSMNWVFLYSERAQFLTSDNPVFFFESEGIARSTSELTFPLSSSVSLWAHRGPPSPLYLEARPVAIREINRRTAFNSTRFVYSLRNEHWVLPFVMKRDKALNRLQFQ
jgi:hypothetical protein